MLEERTALLSDVHGVCVYLVGDRPRSWSWCNDNEEGAGASRCLEEALDKLSMGSGHLGVQIRLDGEPEFPDKQNGRGKAVVWAR